MIGQKISHYRILEKLGEGGMGVVYKAEDTRLKRIVALKFLPPIFSTDKEAQQRFIHEAQAASALNHTNICSIHTIEEFEKEQFIDMEFVEGKTLGVLLKEKVLTLMEVVNTALQIAEGLNAAHKKGIVHRDIKPDNIMLTDDRHVKIMDFGLAKLKGSSTLTKLHTTLGTLSYMSPEQARGEEVDQRTDIFSLGAVVYEMITGRRPFSGEHEAVIMYSIMNESPEPLARYKADLPDETQRVIDKALAKDRDKRYQHVDELLVDLRALQKNLEMGRSISAVNAPLQMTKHKRFLYGSAAIIVVVAVVLGVISFLLPTSEVLDSVAVLPLENRSGDSNQEYFCDGMTDAVITELQKIKSLRIISWTSVRKYKKSDKSLPEIAKELGVKAVVEGSVLREGETVRINVQLIQASPEKHMWANAFDRSMRNILALQSEVAQAIVQEIKVVVTPDEHKRLPATYRAVNPEAHELYLKGKFFSEKAGAQENDLKTAIGYFNMAIAKDSNYAPSYSGLSLAYYYLSNLGWLSPEEAFPKAEQAASKALQKDSTLVDAQVLLAVKKYIYDWDWRAAEKQFRLAIELNPGSSRAHDEYSQFLSGFASMDACIAENKRAQELDPLSLNIKMNLVYIYWIDPHQYDKAISVCKAVLEMDPRYFMAYEYLGLIYLAQNRFAEALEVFRKYEQLWPEDIYNKSHFALAYARMGDRVRAEDYVRQIVEDSAKTYFPVFHLAILYAQMGQKDQAIESLEKACQKHEMYPVQAKFNPFLDPLRPDPRFKALLQKMGLDK